MLMKFSLSIVSSVDLAFGIVQLLSFDSSFTFYPASSIYLSCQQMFAVNFVVHSLLCTEIEREQYRAGWCSHGTHIPETNHEHTDKQMKEFQQM